MAFGQVLGDCAERIYVITEVSFPETRRKFLRRETCSSIVRLAHRRVFQPLLSHLSCEKSYAMIWRQMAFHSQSMEDIVWPLPVVLRRIH